MEWDVDEEMLCVHLGRVAGPDEPLHKYQSREEPERGLEDPADGCPGGDQRSRFVLSLLHHYYRRPDDNGNRVPNPRLDRCLDDLVLDAIALFEMEQDASFKYVEHIQMEAIKRKRHGH